MVLGLQDQGVLGSLLPESLPCLHPRATAHLGVPSIIARTSTAASHLL